MSELIALLIGIGLGIPGGMYVHMFYLRRLSGIVREIGKVRHGKKVL